jgi:pentatricopeptide repeat protein
MRADEAAGRDDSVALAAAAASAAGVSAPDGGSGLAEGDDLGSQLRVRREHTVIAVAVNARRWDEACEALDELERRG